MIAPEGTRLVLAACLLGLVLAGGGAALGGWGWGLVGVGALVAAGTAWGLRDPDRSPPPGADHLLLAPADGRVVEIEREREPVYLGGAANRVSIALTPLGARVIRSPATGAVELVDDGSGEGAATESRIGVRHDAGVPLLVRQLSGARPSGIRHGAAAGARMSAGQRVGVLLYGGRVDVSVPVHVELDVELGQRTVAGETVIGRLPSSASGDGLGRLSEAPHLQIP